MYKNMNINKSLQIDINKKKTHTNKQPNTTPDDDQRNGRKRLG